MAADVETRLRQRTPCRSATMSSARRAHHVGEFLAPWAAKAQRGRDAGAACDQHSLPLRSRIRAGYRCGMKMPQRHRPIPAARMPAGAMASRPPSPPRSQEASVWSCGSSAASLT